MQDKKNSSEMSTFSAAVKQETSASSYSNLRVKTGMTGHFYVD